MPWSYERNRFEQLPNEDPEKPEVSDRRPDIHWCIRCDSWHRDDYIHPWHPWEV